MAKIRHNNFFDTINESIAEAKKEGVLHLYSEDEHLTGNTIKINGKELFHFGTTGYLGLEQDERIKEAAISAICKYGTQFPLSKTYLSNPLYNELESKIELMYNIPPIITKNSTLGHLGVIPSIINNEDAVILDHQVHWSVQNACSQLKLRGIPVDIIRHNNCNMLEDKLKLYSSKHKKVWYMADGVYSMFGDYAPIAQLLELSKKYPQLHIYFDDVHGMSWKGKNGTGFVMSKLNQLPENILLMGTLSKTFGASGAFLICSNPAMREKIKNFGGPLTFSAQLEPASVAAAIASANIHLSEEIEFLQKDLERRIDLFHQCVSKTDLPMIELNNSPVFFLGTAMPATTYKLIQKLFKSGYFANPALYPAVPIKNTGIRITISRHNNADEIKSLVKTMNDLLQETLVETGNNRQKIGRAFNTNEYRISKEVPLKTPLRFNIKKTINDFDKNTWNNVHNSETVLDWDLLHYLETVFKNNPASENNWEFYYCSISDEKNQIVVATVFTLSTWKDDMLFPESVSLEIEEIRKKEPYHFTSKVLAMGTLFTEGNHFYIDNAHPLAEEALKLLLEKAEEIYHESNAELMVLRDFATDNKWNSLFHNHGFIKIDMPESCIFDKMDWKNSNDFKNILSKRSRRHFKDEILAFEEDFAVKIKNKLTAAEIDIAYNLYESVKNKNYAINTFTYPIEVFQKMNNHPQWEFILMYLKKDNTDRTIGIAFCYKGNDHSYSPFLIGMNYDYLTKVNLYKQILYQILKRSKDLNFKKVNFGFSATFEKRKLGATAIPKVAYIQSRDNFTLERIANIQKK
ncbi:2-amino-3-ketobutyrate coenzyme A ligase [Flavobacterium limnosediminis JC2902]|uniref:2-amino-3-ketobutyrate coenzyme A ligase n=1 Tax=Flavobacterium limnosediminis JC2902 TaxID=1341181 RepID=V6SWH6_9FLAO|nr:aminotransferase class I/II-fold pyridoxal phosphate-dependent enzyme [Flavobacterium limnosediminis]ESU28755.1 2-amino-3-ketobutyrate coenzyme A ligase [Flavobacterium limnosediminis JC2902]